MLLPKDIRIYGSCFHTDGKRVIDSPPVPSRLRRQLNKATITDAMHEAYTEIAEIEMLRRGAVLISTMQSDRGRLVHYLRYPHYANTHYLIPSMFDESGVNPITFCF